MVCSFPRPIPAPVPALGASLPRHGVPSGVRYASQGSVGQVEAAVCLLRRTVLFDADRVSSGASLPARRRRQRLVEPCTPRDGSRDWQYPGQERSAMLEIL